jgi:dolichol-phosphate mannosyltransferase|tara:strand:+ start:835 stop:1527 length:693 start_codon:yes stop_codon:yes gene_type:complete
MNKILIFTATYNEVSNINILLDKINSYCQNVDVLVIDDNSSDGTINILKMFEEKYENINLIIREKKLGLNTAHKIGYNYAVKNNYDYFITLDADLSHDPAEIPKFIKLLNSNSFVIGSRYAKGGKCELPIARLLLSVLGNKFIKLFTRIKCSEFTTSYRGFNLRRIKNFDMNLVKSNGYSFFMETIFLVSKFNEIIEIPIYFKNRTSGKSKIPKIEIIRTLINLFRLRLF